MHFYANTTLFILKHSYMLQPSRDHPRGVLIHFVSQIISICKYQITERRFVRCVPAE